MAGSLVHCHLHACPGGLLQLEHPQIWTSTALLLGAACGQLSLCSMSTSTALLLGADLQPTGTVLNVHCPAVADLRRAGIVLHVDQHCPMTGSLVHCCVHTCPGGLLQLEHPQIWTSTALLLGAATVTVLNVDQHCPMTGSLVHCHLCAWATPIRAPPDLDQHCPLDRIPALRVRLTALLAPAGC